MTKEILSYNFYQNLYKFHNNNSNNNTGMSHHVYKKDVRFIDVNIFLIKSAKE